MTILSKSLDFGLIKFPILFPIIYLFILVQFPSYENFLIIFTILFLAETHFGATWPFLFDKKNLELLKLRKLKLIIIPILIILFSIVSYFTIKYIFLLIFFMSNIYHVTRQSIGICKLYSKNLKEFEFQKLAIYYFALLFFLIAFSKFYLQYEITSKFNLTIVCIILIFVTLGIYIYLFKFTENLFCLITGILIFFPVCFLDNPVHLILLGVTMHYSQYIAMTYKVTVTRKIKNKIERNIQRNFFDYINIYFFSSIILYSIVMSFFSYYTKDIINPDLILIPIVGQLLHFYLDSQLWKFSIKHNVENVLKNLLYKHNQS